MNPSSSKGKHALVTGGSRGIGRAIAWALAEAGYAVSFIYNKSDGEANTLVLEGKGKGYDLRAFKYDLSDLSGIDGLLRDITGNFGPVDVLVNNAGMKVRTEFLTSTIPDWDQTISTNLKSVYFLTQAVAREMAKRGRGRVVNIASQSGARHVENSIEYGLSKAGVIYLTVSLAKALAPFGLTVNAVSPGRTYTDLTGYSKDASKEARALSGIPLKRINSPGEIAAAVLFFVSEDSRNVTGQILGIDGGEALC